MFRPAATAYDRQAMFGKGLLFAVAALLIGPVASATASCQTNVSYLSGVRVDTEVCGVAVGATAKVPFSGTVGTWSVQVGFPVLPSSYATLSPAPVIDWGDGTTSAGVATIDTNVV